MREASTLRLTALAAALGLAAMFPASVSAARYNNRGAAMRQQAINTLQAQLNQARQMLAAAQAEMSAAQGQVDDSKSRVETAKSALESAKSDQRNSHQTLEQIENDLIEKAGFDSELGKAHAEYLAAEDAHAVAKKNVLNGTEYKEKAAAIDPADRAKELPVLRKEAFANDSDYQHALKRLNLAKTRWGQLRTAMVQKSEEWMAASKAVRDAQQEENKADGQAKAGALARMPAAARLRDAREIVEEATMTIVNCEAALRQLGVNPTPPAKTTAKK